jgi:hypothetical protein
MFDAAKIECDQSGEVIAARLLLPHFCAYVVEFLLRQEFLFKETDEVNVRQKCFIQTMITCVPWFLVLVVVILL